MLATSKRGLYHPSCISGVTDTQAGTTRTLKVVLAQALRCRLTCLAVQYSHQSELRLNMIVDLHCHIQPKALRDLQAEDGDCDFYGITVRRDPDGQIAYTVADHSGRLTHPPRHTLQDRWTGWTKEVSTFRCCR
jgi:hypothetical protein